LKKRIANRLNKRIYSHEASEARSIVCTKLVATCPVCGRRILFKSESLLGRELFSEFFEPLYALAGSF
jgi:DNA-directed RNA polymerase subunit RPC12/RpoP